MKLNNLGRFSISEETFDKMIRCIKEIDQPECVPLGLDYTVHVNTDIDDIGILLYQCVYGGLGLDADLMGISDEDTSEVYKLLASITDIVKKWRAGKGTLLKNITHKSFLELLGILDKIHSYKITSPEEEEERKVNMCKAKIAAGASEILA